MAKKTTDTKTRILEATRTLFSTHGCETTTIDDIITASGVTKGAFYHYFKSKESLCQTVVEQLTEEYQKLADSIDPALEPIDQLREMIEKLAQLNASGEWVNCNLILRLSLDSHAEFPKIQTAVRNFWQWYTGFYEDLITRCRQADQLATTLDVKTQTALLLSLLSGIITIQKIDPDNPGLKDMTETIIKTLQN